MQKKHGPWTIVSSETKYKNPWIEVVEDKVIRPDGKPGIYGVVNLAHGKGVCVLAIDEKNFVYLTHEFKYASGKEHLEGVAGGLDAGETPLEAAKRELKEEAGIEASEWLDVGSVEPFTGIFKHEVHLFIAKNLTFGNPQREGTEVSMKIAKMKLEEALEKVMKSEITNGPSVALILKAKLFLEREKGEKP